MTPQDELILAEQLDRSLPDKKVLRKQWLKCLARIEHYHLEIRFATQWMLRMVWLLFIVAIVSVFVPRLWVLAILGVIAQIALLAYAGWAQFRAIDVVRYYIRCSELLGMPAKESKRKLLDKVQQTMLDR